MFAGLFLYLSAITPFSLYNQYNLLMVTIKLFFFIIFFFISRKKILLKYFIISIVVIILGLAATIISQYEFSYSRFFLYSIILIFFSFRLEYLQSIFFFKRLYIISVFILCIVSFLNPEIINFFYGWNSIIQQTVFLENKKYVSIFGLPATASLCYGLIIFLLLNNQNLFKKEISIILALFFIFLLISLWATSTFITIFFLLIYFLIPYFKREKLLIVYYSKILFIFFFFTIYFLYNDFFLELANSFYNIYEQTVTPSFMNRFSEQYLFYGLNISYIFFGLGFTGAPSVNFGDIGYFDNIIRLGFFGAILYYSLFYCFLKRLLPNKNYFILILYLFILELGHTYSKSIVFLPIILIILSNPINKFIEK